MARACRYLGAGILTSSLLIATAPSAQADRPDTTAAAVAQPEAPAPKRCPSEMALVGETCVDKYEASLLEIRDDGTEVPFSPYEIPKHHRVRAVSRPGVVPQAYISMVEAKRACVASGKRLCRSREWKAACRGPANTRYPYGDERVHYACVDTHRVSPVNKIFGGGHTEGHMNDPRLNQLERTVAPTGTAPACTNAYGVYDMVGNLHEWVDEGVFRGGYYLDTEINGEGCDYITAAHIPIYHDYSTGFRCCADADSLPVEEEEEPAHDETPAETTAPAPHERQELATCDPDELELRHAPAPPAWDLGHRVTRALGPRMRRRRRRR